jgi:hypothetical protein
MYSVTDTLCATSCCVIRITKLGIYFVLPKRLANQILTHFAASNKLPIHVNIDLR